MKNVLRLELENVVLDFFISSLLILTAILTPSSGIDTVFSLITIGQKLLIILIGLVFYLIVYYPLSASLVYLSRSINSSTYDLKEIIFAFVIVVLFNPFTVSFVVSKMFQGMLTPQNPMPFVTGCGLTVSEIYDFSKVGEAGLVKGDIIKEINGNKVNSVQDVARLLIGKKPGDRFLAQTNKGTLTLELVGDPEEPTFPVLGIYVDPAQCQ